MSFRKHLPNRSRWCWGLLLWAAAARAAGPAGDTVGQPPLADPFSQPLTVLEGESRERFLRGRSLFRRAWVVGPTADGAGTGLGPLYNRLSCIACHPDNGRGQAPDGPDQRMQSMLVRLSVPGRDAHGGPLPHPSYGDQLNEEGIPGVPGEGRAAVSWREHTVTLRGGEKVRLRRPILRFTDLAYGPLDGVLASARVGPTVFGQGLLDAVPEAELRRWAALRHPDGVRGRVNKVWDPVAQRMDVGRFGWKANTASVHAQVVQAAAGDLGLTSAELPGGNCAPRQTACRQAATTPTLPRTSGTRDSPPGHHELTPGDVQALTFYLSELAPPPTRPIAPSVLQRGQRLFSATGCTACHRPTLPVQRPDLPDGSRIEAYTDLLVHDMGPGLADGRPDFQAGAHAWRTAPLWGVGLVPQVNGHSHYLHDGRARSLKEAVLWHGGEARRARQRFAALTPADRETLLAFVSTR